MTDLLAPGQDEAIAEILALAADDEDAFAAWASRLDPDRQRLVHFALATEGLGFMATPATMAVALLGLNPSPLLMFLGRKFRELTDGTDPFQIWNLPARHGKSTIGSQVGPAWNQSLRPAANHILGAYGDDLATRNGQAFRDLLQQHPELGVRLRADTRAKTAFMTEQGGRMLSTQLGGGANGFGFGAGGGLVIDDPYKNWQEAHSEARRRFVSEQFRTVFFLRRDDPSGWILIIHTRWHEKDLTGELLADSESNKELGIQWSHVRLPAIAEQWDPNSNDALLRTPDPLGRRPGEPLDATRIPLPELRTRAVTLGSYLAAALEQQRPSPPEGKDVKRDWFRWSATFPVTYDATATSWDMKLKDSQEGDFVVGQAWGRTGADYWVRHQLRGQWNMGETKAAIALLAVRMPDTNTHYIENTGNGPDLMRQLRLADASYVLRAEVADALGMSTIERVQVQAMIRRGISGMIPVNPKGDKSVRLRAVSGIIEAGHVHLPLDPVGWNPLGLVNEAAEFPGEHDDQVDAMSQALSRMSAGDTSFQPSRRTLNLPTAGGSPRPTARR